MSNKFDRSAFKPTTVKANIEADEKLNDDFNKSSQGDFIALAEGRNILRIYPPHPNAGGKVYAEPKVTTYLPIYQPEFKDNQPVIENGKPKLVLKPKSVYNSRQHGNTKNDVVEKYIEIVEKKAVEKYPGDWKTKEVADARKQFLEPIRGNWEKKINSIAYRATWVCYADHRISFDSQPKFGRWEIGVSIKDRLNKISITAEGADDVMSVDPFTGVDDGRAVIVTKNSKAAKPIDYYITDLDTSTVPREIAGKTYNLNREMPLSDDQLENFMKVTPLVEIYQNCFSRKDLLLQIEGLQNIDKQYGFKVFEDPEFIAVVEELTELYPKIEGEGTTSNSNESVVEKEQARENIQGDELDLYSRTELVDYIMDKELEITIKKSYSEDQLREMIRQAEGQTPEVTSQEDNTPESESTTPEVVTPEEKSDNALSAQERLAQLRNKAKES